MLAARSSPQRPSGSLERLALTGTCPRGRERSRSHQPRSKSRAGESAHRARTAGAIVPGTFSPSSLAQLDEGADAPSIDEHELVLHRLIDAARPDLGVRDWQKTTGH